MRAILWTEYGPPGGLVLAMVPRPAPRAHELLIRVRATTVTAGDCELRALRLSLGFRLLVRALMGPTRPRPKVLGQELAGDVEAVGKDVHRFRPGDAVFGTTGFGFGAYAEDICLPEDPRGAALAIKPAHLGYEEAAAVPTGALEALHFLRRAGDLRGRRVCIVGAAGGIGLFAVQLAKHFGAEVTAVDVEGKLELLRSVGADRAIDHARQDFTALGERFDVILDVVGSTRFAASLATLAEGGHYLVANPKVSTMVRGILAPLRHRKKVEFRAAAQRSEDLVFLGHLLEAGSIRAVIDRRYPLDQMPAAHRYFETGAARGRVVVTV